MGAIEQSPNLKSIEYKRDIGERPTPGQPKESHNSLWAQAKVSVMKVALRVFGRRDELKASSDDGTRMTRVDGTPTSKDYVQHLQ